MLPQPAGNYRSVAAALLLALLAGGCGREETPEAQVRAVIEAGERAAEERDLSALMSLVSPDYQDGRGRGSDELRQYLRGYLVMHQSVHLLTRVESIEFPYRDMARVRLTVGTLGRETAAATAIDLAADVHQVVLELVFEDERWRLIHADWRD